MEKIYYNFIVEVKILCVQMLCYAKHNIKKIMDYFYNMRLTLITILFFIPLVGFCSFPINEIQQEKKSENIINSSYSISKKKSLNIYTKISLISFALTIIFIYSISGGMATASISGPTIANYISYAVLSFSSGVIFGIISLFKR